MKNDVKKAVALGYRQYEGEAPRVLARGKGLAAEKIIAIGEEEGIFIQEDKDLVHLLSQVEIGQNIPTEMYQAVAEILSLVYKINSDYNKAP